VDVVLGRYDRCHRRCSDFEYHREQAEAGVPGSEFAELTPNLCKAPI
jgi:hypothetical protein